MSVKKLDDILSAVGSTAEFLFREITSIHERGSFGDTPLHVVCTWGDRDAVETLIGAGADVNALGEQGKTPLFSAVMGQSVAVVKLLISAGADPSIADEDGITSAEFAQSLKDDARAIPDEMVQLLSPPAG